MCASSLILEIARNVLLYTLLLDDLEGKNTELIWNVYYHAKLDSASLKLLRTQAKKLESFAVSMKEWQMSPYGRLLRFCHTTTFAQVVRLWGFYAVDLSQGEAYREQQTRLKALFTRVNSIHREVVGNIPVYSGVRSATPCASLAVKDIPTFLPKFWKTGVLLPTSGAL